MEIPPELNAYLELLEGSTTAAASGKVATSSTATSSSAAMAGFINKGEGEFESSSSQAALDEMVESVLGSLEKLIAGEELTEEEEDELMSSVWIYFTDSGGQPQFHELPPLFMMSHRSSLCLGCPTGWTTILLMNTIRMASV